MTSPFLSIDIETAPLDADTMLKHKPYVDKGPDLSRVKLEKTRLEKIEEYNKEGARESRERDHFAKLLSGATLDPALCQIISLNWATESGYGALVQGPRVTEKTLLKAFRRKLQDAISRNRCITGFYIVNFDLPIIMARSLVQRVPIHRLFSEHGLRKGRYYSDSRVIDFADVWIDRNPKTSYTIGYKSLCSVFGIEAKTQGFTGEDLHRKWSSQDKDDQEACLAYCREEAKSLQQLSRRILGVMHGI